MVTFVFTIADDAKEEALDLARRFQNIGYGILATEGTAAFFASHGLQAQPVGKIGDDDKDIPSFVRKGRIQAIINTVGTKTNCRRRWRADSPFSY